MNRKFTLQYLDEWGGDWNNWADESQTFTFEEAKAIYESHYAKNERRWRILEAHDL